MDFVSQRISMVETQIKARGVTDPRVLSAMLAVERHLFVPPEAQELAYYDTPLAIGAGQTISQPYIVAYMAEQLKLTGREKVLEIGTGSGYEAAVLSMLCEEVYSVEIIAPLAKKAEKLLGKLGYKNVHVRIGDGSGGWEENAPYDAVIASCAPENIPPVLAGQLKEGGRLVIPVGALIQELVLVEKKKGKFHTKTLIPVRFVEMLGNTSGSGGTGIK